MENSNDIIELLDILYGMVNEAWGVPLGNDKCIIEREKAIDIINEIKANLPTSIQTSCFRTRRVYRQCKTRSRSHAKKCRRTVRKAG